MHQCKYVVCMLSSKSNLLNLKKVSISYMLEKLQIEHALKLNTQTKKASAKLCVRRSGNLHVVL
jgi:hypothetical protein